MKVLKIVGILAFSAAVILAAAEVWMWAYTLLGLAFACILFHVLFTPNRILKIPCKIENGILTFTSKNATHLVLVGVFVEGPGMNVGVDLVNIHGRHGRRLLPYEHMPRFLEIVQKGNSLFVFDFPARMCEKQLYIIPFSSAE